MGLGVFVTGLSQISSFFSFYINLSFDEFYFFCESVSWGMVYIKYYSRQGSVYDIHVILIFTLR